MADVFGTASRTFHSDASKLMTGLAVFIHEVDNESAVFMYLCEMYHSLGYLSLCVS